MTLQKTINNIQNSKTRFFNLYNVWVNLDIVKNGTTIIENGDDYNCLKINFKTIIKPVLFDMELLFIIVAENDNVLEFYIFKNTINESSLYLQGFMGSKNIIEQRNVF